MKGAFKANWKTFFCFTFRLTEQTSKNVVDTTFKVNRKGVSIIWVRLKSGKAELKQWL